MNQTPRIQSLTDEVPSIHALLIGVSDYPALYEHKDDPAPDHHLGLRKLRSPALTVYRIHEWLERRREFLPLPLASLRVLVSPSASELEIAPALEKWSERADLANTLSAIEQWREKLAHNPESIALFYFAGHGVKRERRDDVLMLDGFGSTPMRILRHAIDSISLIDGMAPSKQFPDIARNQLYFFDACRVKPALFKNYENVEPDPIWDKTELNKKDDRSMLILYTTVAGAEAYGRSDEQSLFSRALIQCLDGAAAESADAGLMKWSVTGTSLAKHLQTQLDKVNREYKLTQLVQVGKSPVRDFVLNRLETPPAVNVCLQIEPEAASAWAKVQVFDQQDTTAWKLPFPVKPLPHPGTLPAGMYVVRATDCREDPESAVGGWFRQATPQITDWSIPIIQFKNTS
jgi:Caspase domain